MTITFKEVYWKGKALYGCKIQKDMTAEQVTKVLVDAIEAIEKEIDLSQVQLLKLGIHDKCKLQVKNLLTATLNALITADENFAQTINEIQTQINNVVNQIGIAVDEKVKASAADTTAGYLGDKIISQQVGPIKYNTTSVELAGFLPIGAVIMIDASRLGDFDGTGKGKTGTDVWGFAISNGQNGTRNRLGKFPRFTTTLVEAGNTGGANSISISKDNISSFDLAVSGAIADGLADDVFAKIRFNTNKIADGSGGSTLLLRLGDGLSGSNEMRTLGFNVKHSHTFTLKSSHVNPTPVAVSILPEYINEIPIQRINV